MYVIGVECECPSGYELSEDESHCHDINECEIYENGSDEDDSDDYYEDRRSQLRASFCSHTCTNLIGKRLMMSYDFTVCAVCMSLVYGKNTTLLIFHVIYIGSFICSCPENFHIHDDLRTCIRDYCADLENDLLNKTKCSHECVDAHEGL